MVVVERRLLPKIEEKVPRDPDVESRLAVCRESGQEKFLRHEAFWAATGLHRAPTKEESGLMRSIAPEFGLEAAKPSLQIPLSILDGYVDRLAEAMKLREQEKAMQKFPAAERGLRLVHAETVVVELPTSTQEVQKTTTTAPAKQAKTAVIATEVVPQEAEPLTDEEVKALVARAVGKDQEAFGALYDAYVGRIYQYIYSRVRNHHDAEDLSSQVFLNAWRAIGRYQQMDRPFASWLFSIASNQIRDYRNKLNRRPPSSSIDQRLEESGTQLFDRKAGPEETVVQEEENERLRRAFLELKPNQQEALLLHFRDSVDYASIATIMGKREGAVRAIVHRALGRLEGKLRGEQEEAPKPTEGMVFHAFADFVRIRAGDRLSERQKRVFTDILRRHGAVFNRNHGFLISEEAFRKACEEGIQVLGIVDAAHGARTREGRIRAKERRVAQVPVQVFPGN